MPQTKLANDSGTAKQRTVTKSTKAQSGPDVYQSSVEQATVQRKEANYLQQNLGNQAIGQFAKQSASDPNLARNSLQRIVHAQTQTSIQAKLIVGLVNDQYEQEADRVAKQVLTASTASPIAQRSGEEEELQAKALAETITPFVQRTGLEDEELLQGKSLIQRSGEGFEAGADFESQLSAARGSGQALEPDVQAQMGQAMGVDFSGIKVHTDARSDQLNRSIQARAFTTGNDIFFGKDEYNPSSSKGKELLAHELTHTLQQGAAPLQRQEIVQMTRGRSNAIVGVPDEVRELRAENHNAGMNQQKNRAIQEGQKAAAVAPNERQARELRSAEAEEFRKESIKIVNYCNRLDSLIALLNQQELHVETWKTRVNALSVAQMALGAGVLAVGIAACVVSFGAAVPLVIALGAGASAAGIGASVSKTALERGDEVSDGAKETAKVGGVTAAKPEALALSGELFGQGVQQGLTAAASPVAGALNIGFAGKRIYDMSKVNPKDVYNELNFGEISNALQADARRIGEFYNQNKASLNRELFLMVTGKLTSTYLTVERYKS